MRYSFLPAFPSVLLVKMETLEFLYFLYAPYAQCQPIGGTAPRRTIQPHGAHGVISRRCVLAAPHQKVQIIICVTLIISFFKIIFWGRSEDAAPTKFALLASLRMCIFALPSDWYGEAPYLLCTTWLHGKIPLCSVCAESAHRRYGASPYHSATWSAWSN